MGIPLYLVLLLMKSQLENCVLVWTPQFKKDMEKQERLSKDDVKGVGLQVIYIEGTR